MVSKIIRICEKNKVSLSNKMNWKKGHDTKIVSYHSIFSPYNQESATFQKCRNSRQSGCLPRVIGHLPSSQVTFHRFFLGLEACPILPWPFQPPSQHFRQRHYHPKIRDVGYSILIHIDSDWTVQWTPVSKYSWPESKYLSIPVRSVQVQSYGHGWDSEDLDSERKELEVVV